MASILAGELVYVGFYFKVLPGEWTGGFLSVVPVMIAAIATLVLVSLATSQGEKTDDAGELKSDVTEQADR